MNEFIVKDQASRVSAIEFIANLDLEELGQQRIRIDDKKPDRSLQQNRLMWMWNGVVGKEIGTSADYVHGLSKREILLPYLLGLDKHSEEALFNKAVIEALTKESHKIKAAYSMIRTSKLSVQEMKEYLDLYQLYWSVNGQIVLPNPENLMQ